MIDYDDKLKTITLKCDRCRKIFIEGKELEICDYVSELRALSIKYGWRYHKGIKNNRKVQENICPWCVRENEF